MKAMVNGLEVGWDGISNAQLTQQERLARLPPAPLLRSRDMRRPEPYGRLLVLHKVACDPSHASRSALWLCRCTCPKGTLLVVMAQNLGKPGKTEGCGCVHSERASRCIKDVTSRPTVRERISALNRVRMIRYQAENKEAVRERARVHGITFLADPAFLAWRHELVRARRKARGLDPDVPIASRAVLIRNATFPLRSHILRVRDRFTCVLCGATGKGKLAVHHCIPVEQEWGRVADPFNLVTLCFECHFRRAHGGWWKGLDRCVQVTLLAAAVAREHVHATPAGIVHLVRSRLDALGAPPGQTPLEALHSLPWQW